MIARIWARLRRWWHCLWNLHRPQDVFFTGVVGNVSYDDVISWIGCDCGKGYWHKTDWPPLTEKEKEVLRWGGFQLGTRYPLEDE